MALRDCSCPCAQCVCVCVCINHHMLHTVPVELLANQPSSDQGVFFMNALKNTIDYGHFLK